MPNGSHLHTAGRPEPPRAPDGVVCVAVISAETSVAATSAVSVAIFFPRIVGLLTFDLFFN